MTEQLLIALVSCIKRDEHFLLGHAYQSNPMLIVFIVIYIKILKLPFQLVLKQKKTEIYLRFVVNKTTFMPCNGMPCLYVYNVPFFFLENNLVIYFQKEKISKHYK
jgi:hypothetical protein